MPEHLTAITGGQLVKIETLSRNLGEKPLVVNDYFKAQEHIEDLTKRWNKVKKNRAMAAATKKSLKQNPLI